MLTAAFLSSTGYIVTFPAQWSPRTDLLLLRAGFAGTCLARGGARPCTDVISAFPPRVLPMSDSPDLHDDAPARRTLFLAAWLLMLVPFVQAASQIWPLQLGNIQWRFGAANALSSVLLLPFLGLSLLLVLARSLERQGLARLVGSLAALFCLGILGSVVLFVLDAQELKSIVSSQMAGQFTMTTARVALVSVLFVFGFLLLAVFGFASLGHQRKDAARKTRRAETEGPESDSPLIVGR
jgi:hypothetical protein